MAPCSTCEGDPDICHWHPCNGCGADDDECTDCHVVTEGFDCNMYERQCDYDCKHCEYYSCRMNPLYELSEEEEINNAKTD